jgi:Domain of unknown function (DUF4136)
MRLLKIVSLFAAAALSACTQVSTQVDAYSSIPEDINPKTIYISPYQAKDANNLKWRANSKTLAQVMEESGFTVVSSKREARLTAFFGFAVDQGEVVQTAYSIPQWGVTGYSGANTYGTFYGNTYSGTTTLIPTYGITGYSTGSRKDTIFTRSVAIDMVDNTTRQKVFQARAVSRGSCNSFAPVAASIIKAVMTNFPKGKTGSVILPMEGEC